MNEKIISLAAEVLKISADEAVKNSKPITELNATYFWNPTRGGAAVIIDANCDKLAATSAVSLDAHVQAFKDGKRN
jgi:hypothetical protein